MIYACTIASPYVKPKPLIFLLPNSADIVLSPTMSDRPRHMNIGSDGSKLSVSKYGGFLKWVIPKSPCVFILNGLTMSNDWMMKMGYFHLRKPPY